MLTSGHSQLRLWHSQLSASSFVGAQLITHNKTLLGSGLLESTAGHLLCHYCDGKGIIQLQVSLGSGDSCSRMWTVATLGPEVVISCCCPGRACWVGKALADCVEGLRQAGLCSSLVMDWALAPFSQHGNGHQILVQDDLPVFFRSRVQRWGEYSQHLIWQVCSNSAAEPSPGKTITTATWLCSELDSEMLWSKQRGSGMH